MAMIERLQIGRILVENVEAIVLDDKALARTLIGMSFLNRLGKYQVENGALLHDAVGLIRTGAQKSAG